MRLEYRHNGGFDSVLLVGEDGKVRSDWTVTPEVAKEFADCSIDAGDWDDRFGDEHDPEDYGVLVAVREGYTLRAEDEELWVERVEFFADRAKRAWHAESN